ncbi:MAG TPA: RHS repeat-associated core domain-containing protein, partial [Terriglobales bacterium]|nr:RHS repeat-associated core domain-containing protein [Terriglobales bacterium]
RGMVVEALDPDTGKTARIGYDADYTLLPVTMDDPLGLRTQAAYDPRWLQIVALTDPHGHSRHVRLNDLGLVAATWMRSRDGREGDTADRPLSVLEYDLHAFAKDGTPICVRSRERVYHALDGDVPAGADADAEIVAVAYSDGFGRELQRRALAEAVVYGSGPFADGVLPPARSAQDFAPCDGAENVSRVVVSGWKRHNNKGAVVQQWEPFFDEGFAYRRPTREQLGQSVRFRLHPGGDASRTIHPDGSEIVHVRGVPRALDCPDDVRPTPWEAYTYDPQDNGGRTHPVEHAASATHWNTPTSIVLDALGRAVRQVVRTRDLETGALEEWRAEIAYDVQGRTRYATDELGRRTTSHELTRSGGGVVRAYDLLGRAWWARTADSRHPGAAAQPGTQRAVLDAQGRIIEAWSPRGSWTFTVLDAWHRPVAVWSRDDDARALGMRQVMEYGETVYGTDDARARHALNRIVRHYDEAGLQRVDAFDFRGRVLEKTRVVLGDRLLLDVFAAGAWDTLAPYRVDWQDPMARAGKLGDAFTTTTAYDALNRPKRMTLPVDAEGKRRVVRPGYNRAGALERLEVSDGTTTRTIVERIAHDARGQRVLLLHGGGVLCRYAYDPRTRRLARARSERATVAGARITPKKDDADPLAHVFQDTSYVYDLVGNPLAVLEETRDCGLPATPDRLERRFTYDPLYRLLSATGRETDFLDGTFVPRDVWAEGAPRSEDVTRARRYEETYAYDRTGNLRRLKRGSHVRTYEAATANNRLDRFVVPGDTGSVTYEQAYDDAGNLTRQGRSRHLVWDQANRLIAFGIQATPASEPSVYAQYLHDSAGGRVVKLVRRQGGEWERLVAIDGVFEHAKRVKPASTRVATRLYVMDGHRRLRSLRFGDPLDDRTPPDKIHLDDHLGSATMTLDDAARLVNREEYRPYGETCFGSHAFKRFRFTGRERDEESGFQYHGARYYDAAQARWVSADPVVGADGHNRYAYARGNPIRLADPSGTQSNEPRRDTLDMHYFMMEDPGGMQLGWMEFFPWPHRLGHLIHGDMVYHVEPQAESREKKATPTPPAAGPMTPEQFTGRLGRLNRTPLAGMPRLVEGYRLSDGHGQVVGWLLSSTAQVTSHTEGGVPPRRGGALADFCWNPSIWLQVTTGPNGGAEAVWNRAAVQRVQQLFQERYPGLYRARGHEGKGWRDFAQDFTATDCRLRLRALDDDAAFADADMRGTLTTDRPVRPGADRKANALDHVIQRWQDGPAGTILSLGTPALVWYEGWENFMQTGYVGDSKGHGLGGHVELSVGLVRHVRGEEARIDNHREGAIPDPGRRINIFIPAPTNVANIQEVINGRAVRPGFEAANARAILDRLRNF